MPARQDPGDQERHFLSSEFAQQQQACCQDPRDCGQLEQNPAILSRPTARQCKTQRTDERTAENGRQRGDNSPIMMDDSQGDHGTQTGNTGGCHCRPSWAEPRDHHAVAEGRQRLGAIRLQLSDRFAKLLSVVHGPDILRTQLHDGERR